LIVERQSGDGGALGVQAATARVFDSDRQRRSSRMQGGIRQVGGMKRGHVRKVRQQINRAVRPLQQAHARRVLDRAGGHGIARTMRDSRQIENGRPGKAFNFRQSGKRNEMHDDAARKPHCEQQTERDA
jgi:hypothetical protein